jgi:hypothetical protein
MSLSTSHSSSASITITTIGIGRVDRFKPSNGWRSILSNCSFSPFVAMSESSWIASWTLGISWGMLFANCLIIVGKSFVAFSQSTSPLLKKKFAPSKLAFCNISVTVLEIVDLPVPLCHLTKKCISRAAT